MFLLLLSCLAPLFHSFSFVNLVALSSGRVELHHEFTSTEILKGKLMAADRSRLRVLSHCECINVNQCCDLLNKTTWVCFKWYTVMSWSPYLFTSLQLVSSELLNVTVRLLLCLNSESASFRGAFEGQLCHNTKRRLSQSDLAPPNAANKMRGCTVTILVASHITRFFALPKKKKEREEITTSRGVDRHFCGPGRQKSWCQCKTSGDVTRKWSKG